MCHISRVLEEKKRMRQKQELKIWLWRICQNWSKTSQDLTTINSSRQTTEASIREWYLQGAERRKLKSRNLNSMNIFFNNEIKSKDFLHLQTHTKGNTKGYFQTGERGSSTSKLGDSIPQTLYPGTQESRFYRNKKRSSGRGK